MLQSFPKEHRCSLKTRVSHWVFEPACKRIWTYMVVHFPVKGGEKLSKLFLFLEVMAQCLPCTTCPLGLYWVLRQCKSSLCTKIKHGFSMCVHTSKGDWGKKGILNQTNEPDSLLTYTVVSKRFHWRKAVHVKGESSPSALHDTQISGCTHVTEGQKSKQILASLKPSSHNGYCGNKCWSFQCSCKGWGEYWLP